MLPHEHQDHVSEGKHTALGVGASVSTTPKEILTALDLPGKSSGAYLSWPRRGGARVCWSRGSAPSG